MGQFGDQFGHQVNGRQPSRVQHNMSVITAALAGVGVAASILCPVAAALSRAAWIRGMRRGYSKARSTYDRDVMETATAILSRGLAWPGPTLRTFPGSQN